MGNKLVDLTFSVSLFLSKIFNRLFGRPSSKFASILLFLGFFFLPLFQVFYVIFVREEPYLGFLISFLFVFDFFWYVIISKIIKTVVPEIQSSYKSPEIVLLPVIPNYTKYYRVHHIFIVLTYFSFLYNLSFTITNFVATYFVSAFYFLLLFIIATVRLLFAGSSTFYHNIYDTSLYVRIKQKVKNALESRNRIPAFVPVGS